MIHSITDHPLTLEKLKEILNSDTRLEFSSASIKKVEACREFLDQKLSNSSDTFYGINTGFGSLCNVKISADDTESLQKKLVMSHACGAGNEVPEEIVRIMLLLKIQNLSYGFSGVRLKILESLAHLYNNKLHPVIFQQGSLGASGDLAPLAHLALPLLGMGKVNENGNPVSFSQLTEAVKFMPIRLQAKEGLAMLNGTQFSSAYAVWALMKCERLIAQADMIAALSIDAFDCRSTPYDERLHQIRPHHGQLHTAKTILQWTKGSPLSQREKNAVQDPYAFRCVPQVHGATKDTFDHVKKIVTTEINSVTDNPTLFYETDAILSGGNFHAQPLALVLDFLAIAIAELGSISERRTYQLISGQRDLPPFLIKNPGLNSGFMIPQYTAASIVSQNKQLCTPASVDSIVSSNGQEDHVSMAANAATKLYSVVNNVAQVLAIELMTAAQAMSFRKEKTSDKLEAVVYQFRKVVPELNEDRILHEDMKNALDFVWNSSL